MGAPRKAYLDEAARLYERGLSVGEVAAHYGVSRQSMWKSLRRRLGALRPQVRMASENHFHRGGPRRHRQANHLVEQAIAKGILARPGKCEKCPAKSNLQAHHDDYAKPLSVRWLCKRCHFSWHRDHRARPASTPRSL